MHFRTSLLFRDLVWFRVYCIHTYSSLVIIFSITQLWSNHRWIIESYVRGLSEMDDNEANDTVSKVKFLIKLVFLKIRFYPFCSEKWPISLCSKGRFYTEYFISLKLYLNSGHSTITQARLVCTGLFLIALLFFLHFTISLPRMCQKAVYWQPFEEYLFLG